jgi:hypothetical protein
MRSPINLTPLFMSGVVSCIPLEVLLTKASDHPVWQDLYFLFRHRALAAL